MRHSFLFSLLVLLVVVGSSRPARAATTWTCDEAGVDAALKVGGASTFSCAAVTTIVFARPKVIGQPGTSLDGGGRLVLSGGGAIIPLTVRTGVDATLANLTIEKGHGDLGGNIVVTGKLTLNDVTLRAGDSAGGGSGVYVEAGGVLIMSRSTVSESGGTDTEGAIAVHGTAQIDNSTVSDVRGRGIGVRNAGRVDLTASTVVAATEPLYVDRASTMSVQSSIVVSTNKSPVTVANGTFVSGGYNLVGTDTRPAKQFSEATDIVGVTPSLGALASNGGLTQTRALADCSPGVGAGPTASRSLTDQRGAKRVQGGASDIGAYESAGLPCLRVNDVGVNEGNAGTAAVGLTVSLSGRSTLEVGVSYATADGTATTADKDYTATSGTITFAPGELSKNVAVQVIGDTRFEATEAFVVNLSGAKNATAVDPLGAVTVVNDDVVPSLAVGDVSVGEGDVGTTQASFSVSLSAASSQAVTVAYATSNGTATAPADYTATSGTLTFAAGSVTQTVTVPVVGDVIREGNETFTVTLSAPTNATLRDATGIGTILDNETTPGLVVGSASVGEGNEGQTALDITVVLGTASATAVTVDWTAVDGTATAADQDYTAAGGTLTFAPGETSKTVSVQILGDTRVEDDESFTVHLANAVGAQIGGADGTITITNDDFAIVEADAGADSGAEDAGAQVDAGAGDAGIAFGDSGLSFDGNGSGDSSCDCGLVGTGTGSNGWFVPAGAGLAFALACVRRRRRR